ncbi:MAG TPA: SRPBCC family protein [Armatimonadota bacterium]|jgi:uncharacterized membrane protein
MASIESEVTIEAPLDRVMALARDIERFPEFMKDLVSVKILERGPGGKVVSQWVARVEELRTKIKWTEEDLWDEEAGTCEFHQTEGDYQKMEGVWTFEAVGESTLFRSQVEMDYAVPLLGPLLKGLIARKAKENLDATLAAVKAEAERRG